MAAPCHTNNKGDNLRIDVEGMVILDLREIQRTKKDERMVEKRLSNFWRDM